MMITGYHEERCREWVLSDPDPDLLEGVVFTDFDRHPRAERKTMWLEIMKDPADVGAFDTTLLEVVARESSVLTEEIVGCVIQHTLIEDLLQNDAVTPELIADGVEDLLTPLGFTEWGHRGWEKDRMAQLEPLFDAWTTEERVRFRDRLGGELIKVLRGEIQQLTLFKIHRAEGLPTLERPSLL